MSLGYFELFGLSPVFSIDLVALERNYRKIQSESHPDRFVTAAAAEKLQSMQTATLANEAYQTLKNPASRAKYLLELQGINAVVESNTTMPADFLMQQMEWREAIEDARVARDIAALEKLLNEMHLAAKDLQENLRVDLDERQAYTQAAETVRELSFIDKACNDIEQTIALLED